MIRCKNNTLYTGVANDYLVRWRQHYKGTGARYVRSNGFLKPVFLHEFSDKSSAMKEESFTKKQTRFYKEELIKSDLNILNLDPALPEKKWKKSGYKGKMWWK